MRLAWLYLIEILHQTTTRGGSTLIRLRVVSYRNSTSNHNSRSCNCSSQWLYLIEILHQTTTDRYVHPPTECCILSKFYIKPQPVWLLFLISPSCILSKFYIKPQLARYLYSSSAVVSYRNSTSNHNREDVHIEFGIVVSYRNSTSNHNRLSKTLLKGNSCILSKFYIKPQLSRRCWCCGLCCILSKFYIKPQLCPLH